MDRNIVLEIEQAFCDHYNTNCDRCPISKYKIAEDLAMCHYAFNKESTEEQVNIFVNLARWHWNHKWTQELSNKARRIIGIRAKVV